MKKLIISLFIFLAFMVGANAQKIAPINQDFEKYREFKLIYGNSIADYTISRDKSSFTSGILPKNTSDFTSTAIPSPLLLDSYYSDMAVTNGVYPSIYDLRAYNRVTPVRNQNPWGACWAFAGTSSVESNVLTRYSLNDDYSELNLVNNTGFQRNINTGGNYTDIVAYYSRFNGPVYEVDDPYTNAGGTPITVQPLTRAYVENVRYLFFNRFMGINKSSILDDNNLINESLLNTIKENVTNNGTVYMSYYHSDSYLNTINYAYYYNGDAILNHAVSIAGWDDNYSASNFNIAPPGNGAFLIKNSWGSLWGNAGYFWISYYDKSLTDFTTFYDTDLNTSKYDKIYYNDFGGMLTIMTNRYGRSVFNITSNSKLKAVATYCSAAGAQYKFTVYVNGVNKKEIIGRFTYPGYYTIPLEESQYLDLNQGDVLTIDVDYNNANETLDTNYLLPIECFMTNFYETGVFSPGKSFTSSDGVTWNDLYNLYSAPYNTCIRALVSDNDKVFATGLTLSSNNLTINTGDSATLSATVLPENATYKNVIWSSSDTSVVAINSAGDITGVRDGTATITATATDGSGINASCLVTVNDILVTNITISSENFSLNIGRTATLTASVSPSNATHQPITWASSNTDVATVSSTGVVTGIVPGIVTITAAATDNSGVYSSITVNVIKPVNSITLSSSSLILAPNITSPLFATVLPVDATNNGVIWSSNNTAVATVSSTGVVTAISAGTATIRATAADGSGSSSSCTVTVRITTIFVTSITLNATSLSLDVGNKFTLTGKVLPTNATNRTSTLYSSNPAVATVSPTGVITAISPGTANITARLNDGSGVMATCVVTVNQPIVLVSSISLSSSSLTLDINGSATLGSTVLPENATNKTVTWASSNVAVATVDSSGVVDAISAGTSTITATANDGSGKVGSCLVTVREPVVLVSSISLSSNNLTLDVGGNSILIATILPENATDKTYNWSSSNTAVATVSSAGVVDAISAGTATITATANDGSGITSSCTVTVNVPIVLVSSINLSSSSLSLYVGDTSTLSATVLPENATDKTYTWTSSNTAVATVNASGVVTAVSAGTATITATANDGSGKIGTCTVTVNVPIVLVSSINLSSSSLSLYVGDTSTLSATVLPENATDKTYTWSSNNTAVATVNASGLVTAVSAGTATITATANDGSGVTSSCSVTVNQPIIMINSIDVSPSYLTLDIGGTTVLSAIVTPSNATNKNVTWSSNNTAVATVNASGLVTAVGAGTVTITATATDGSGASSSCLVIVNTPVILVSSINLSSSSLILEVGGTSTLSATVLPENATDKTYTWSSSDAAVATVSSAGLVTAVSAGTAIITATANDGSGKVAICSVTVNVPIVLVSSINLSSSSLTLEVGGTSTLSATVLPSNATNKNVTWSSSNTAVATVNASGLVTAVSAGTATITATANDGSGKVAICSVIVNVPIVLVSSINLSSSSLTLEVGGTSTLSATVLPENATDKTYTWSSSNTAVATVNASGLVTAVGAGTATITATANDGSGKVATCSVTVNVPIVLVSSINLSSSSLSLNVNSTSTLSATVLPSNATNNTVTWSSSNTLVATVSSSGVVTGVGAGTATITATANDGSGITKSCSVTVTKVSVTGVSLSQTSATVYTGSTLALTATVLPTNATNKNVTWSSNNTFVATVDSNGVVTGNYRGTATITVTTVDGSKKATCRVTVKNGSAYMSEDDLFNYYIDDYFDYYFGYYYY